MIEEENIPFKGSQMENSIHSIIHNNVDILQISYSEGEAQQPVRGEPQPVWVVDDEQSSHIPSQPAPRRPSLRPARGSGKDKSVSEMSVGICSAGETLYLERYHIIPKYSELVALGFLRFFMA